MKIKKEELLGFIALATSKTSQSILHAVFKIKSKLIII